VLDAVKQTHAVAAGGSSATAAAAARCMQHATPMNQGGNRF